MKPGKRNTRMLVALLLGVATLPVHAADGAAPDAAMSFKDYDANHDGFLSLDEFKAKGKDSLAFNAADSNGDGRLDRGEFDRYLARKARDQHGAEPDRTTPQDGR